MDTGIKKRKIIIADDKKMELQANATLLKLCGYEPMPVLNGIPAAIEIKANIKEIDAVILDWMMPDLSAEGVLKEVGALLKAHEVPVFILSGMSPDISQEYMDDVGIVKIFEKPISINYLKSSLDNYFSSRG